MRQKFVETLVELVRSSPVSRRFESEQRFSSSRRRNDGSGASAKLLVGERSRSNVQTDAQQPGRNGKLDEVFRLVREKRSSRVCQRDVSPRRLSNGSLSAREIFFQVKRYENERGPRDAGYWIVFELLWRDFFKFIAMKYGTRLFYARGLRSEPYEWKTNPQAFEAWRSETTKAFDDRIVSLFSFSGQNRRPVRRREYAGNSSHRLDVEPRTAERREFLDQRSRHRLAVKLVSNIEMRFSPSLVE